MKQILYQLDSKGRLRFWEIKVEKINDTQFDIVTHDGLVDSDKAKSSRVPITKGLGGKTIQQQAEADAQSEINKKIKKGYVDNIDNVKQRNETLTIKDPAKGHKYHPKGKEYHGKTLDQLDMRGRKIGIEIKLDGFRYRIEVQDEPIFYSSSGDIVPAFPHVSERIKDVLKEYPGFKGAILDGEMYDHEVRMTLGFGAIQTACGTRKHFDTETLELRSRLQFHIFDICGNAWDEYNLVERRALFHPFADGINIIKNELYEEEADDGVINSYFEGALKKEFEGVMLKRLDLPYEYKKSNQWAKYKAEEDDEFQIVDFEESITGGTLGALICVMENGKRFKASTKDELGSEAARQVIWDNKEEYRNKWVTVKFTEYTHDGVPRHAKAKAFRKGKSID